MQRHTTLSENEESNININKGYEFLLKVPERRVQLFKFNIPFTNYSFEFYKEF
jgi:hypothetical protein